jgi:hypothetical protein
MFSTFEILPDEIILHICQYLRGADVLYSLYNLNTRLNVAITGYCRYVNLMAVTYKRFNYVAARVLPCIGYHVRSFLLNAYWETSISTQLFEDLFTSRLPLLCPHLQTLTLRWFSTEKLLLFVDCLENFPLLTVLNIQCLTGCKSDILLPKLFSANHCRLTIISFDSSSIYLGVSETAITIPYPNIEELTINITTIAALKHLFKLIPNVRRLFIDVHNYCSHKFENMFANLSPLPHLVEFNLSSLNWLWTFDEITDIIQTMPSLQKLMLDLRTNDKLLLTKESLRMILPSSCTQIDYCIRCLIFEISPEAEEFLTSQSRCLSTVCLLDETQNDLMIHTIPCGLRSMSLQASIGKQMPSGWQYTQQVENLYICDATSMLEILLILQHFRRIRTLSIFALSLSEIRMYYG